MTVAVAHQVSHGSDDVLAAAAAEAVLRGVRLVVVHAVVATDLDSREALRSGIGEIVERVVSDRRIAGLAYEVRIAASRSTGVDDTTTALLDAADRAGASMIVIGARRRSPVGKAFLGSVTQEVVLGADVPVMVVRT